MSSKLKITSIVDIVDKGIDLVNPFVSNMDTINKDIATTLLDAGYLPKELEHFARVSSSQLENWLELEMLVRDRIKSMANKPEPTETV